MGYLSGQTITIDAILTTKGRESLAKGDFNITQFALSDDEIDYTLYNPNHPSGSAFAGEAIEKQPLTEAFPNETQIMKYKLVTLKRGTSRMPVINVGYSNIVLQQGASINITPQTLNYLSTTSTIEQSGYVLTVGDARLLSSFTATGIDVSNLNIDDMNTSVGASISKTNIGTSFTLVGTTINTLFGTTLTSLTTTLTIVGRDSGARISFPLTINKTS